MLEDTTTSRKYPDPPRRYRLFLHFLFSPSIEKVVFMEIKTGINRVVLRLWDPITDDAIHSASEANGVLPEFETDKLYTEFKLWKFSLFRHLTLKEDRDEFVGRLHELVGPGEGFKQACKALRVRRLGRS